MKKKFLTLGVAVILSILSVFTILADNTVNGNTTINDQINVNEEQAKQIAVKHWNFKEGEVDSDSGFEIAMFSDGITKYEGKSYYTFRLRWFVDNQHWSTIDWLYISADTGETYSSLNEIPTGENTATESKENVTTESEEKTTAAEQKETIVIVEQESTSIEKQTHLLNTDDKENVSKNFNIAGISNSSSINPPKTGDSSLTDLFVIFSATSITGFVVVAFKRKPKKYL